MHGKKLSAGKLDGAQSDDTAIVDEGVLADGMIPDSRIVKLIDELEISSDDCGGETSSGIAQNHLKPDHFNDQ
ncbi:hypothetical protein [Nitrosomonas sp. sh817]|uniref:hypothetical protein n=1 Tax=Nitrosomonas sp. sh817 TaxID=3070658 RepID=UPI0027DE662D|nr:hypothetical protein [Nitrosomonas sp. sh817]WMJ09021.1 hypothetical protein RBH92_02150 [Nitrosomonas sp. sh817]